MFVDRCSKNNIADNEVLMEQLIEDIPKSLKAGTLYQTEINSHPQLLR